MAFLLKVRNVNSLLWALEKAFLSPIILPLKVQAWICCTYIFIFKAINWASWGHLFFVEISFEAESLEIMFASISIFWEKLSMLISLLLFFSRFSNILLFSFTYCAYCHLRTFIPSSLSRKSVCSIPQPIIWCSSIQISGRKWLYHQNITNTSRSGSFLSPLLLLI